MAQRIKLRLEAFTPSIPGRAKLVINGWEGDDSNLKFAIQRNQDHFYLGANAEWSASMVSHVVANLVEDGDNYVINLNSDILDPLLKLMDASYKLHLMDDSGNKADGIFLKGQNLFSSEALGSTPNSAVIVETAPTPVEVEPEPVIEEIVPEPIIEPIVDEIVEQTPVNEPVPPPAPQKSNTLKIILFIIGGLVGLGAILATVLYFMGFFKDMMSNPPEEPVAPAEEVAEVAEPQGASIGEACSVDALKANTNELEFVKTCIKSSPSSNDLLAVIENAKANNLCTVAQRIYAYKAQSGDKLITSAYAKEFDPASNVAGGCFAADAETAIYWYEQLLATDPQNAEVKARLDALKTAP